jgi:hypothetical protein
LIEAELRSIKSIKISNSDEMMPGGQMVTLRVDNKAYYIVSKELPILRVRVAPYSQSTAPLVIVSGPTHSYCFCIWVNIKHMIPS